MSNNMEKKRVLKVNNVMILYNIITILKYTILNNNILYYDFIVDFVYINIILACILMIYNEIIKKGGLKDDE